MPTPAEALPPTCDLLVVGSGAGGLGSAVVGASLGLDVVVVEKAARFGGTTAWSGGWMWVPRNPLAVAAGIVEDLAPVRQYLRHVMGRDALDPAVEAFLRHGPAMLQFHLSQGVLGFIDGNTIADFHGDAPGAREGGRSVCAAPFDGRRLGPHLRRLEPPRDILSFMGMGLAGGADLRHFLRATRSAASLAYVTRRMARHARDTLRHGRGTWLMGGNALAGALLRSALDRGVRLFEDHPVAALLMDGARVAGAEVSTAAGTRRIRARRGVVLACGGFPHDDARKAALFAHAPTGREHHSAAWPGNTGDGLRLAESAGARLDDALADAAAWAPVSLMPRPDGSAAAFPHLVERGKPGLIAVDTRGERFVDEAGDYHRFMRALFARHAPGQTVAAWLIADHRFQRRYGLGCSKPWPLPVAPMLHSGYLQRAPSLHALARRCGIDTDGLLRTVAAYNHHARRGDDPAFGRGRSAYDRLQGDPDHDGPNPCVAPIEHPPYYAVRLVPGSLGTFAGIAADEHGRVLDGEGRPLPGLYAAGNDRAGVMRGHYPSGGITLGPAMTFGYILAHHAAGRPLPMSPPPA